MEVFTPTDHEDSHTATRPLSSTGSGPGHERSPVILPRPADGRLRRGTPVRGDHGRWGEERRHQDDGVLPLLTRETVVLEHVPVIEAVHTQARPVACVGGQRRVRRGCPPHDPGGRASGGSGAAPALVAKERSSFVLVGPLLARTGQAITPQPGGCKIGERPINVGMRALETLGGGAVFRWHLLRPHLQAARARIYLDYPSHTGTENLMMACLANGTTVIKNAPVTRRWLPWPSTSTGWGDYPRSGDAQGGDHRRRHAARGTHSGDARSHRGRELRHRRPPPGATWSSATSSLSTWTPWCTSCVTRGPRCSKATTPFASGDRAPCVPWRCRPSITQASPPTCKPLSAPCSPRRKGSVIQERVFETGSTMWTSYASWGR